MPGTGRRDGLSWRFSGFAELEQMNLWVGCIARVQKRSQRESIIA